MCRSDGCESKTGVTYAKVMGGHLDSSRAAVPPRKGDDGPPEARCTAALLDQRTQCTGWGRGSAVVKERWRPCLLHTCWRSEWVAQGTGQPAWDCGGCGHLLLRESASRLPLPEGRPGNWRASGHVQSGGGGDERVKGGGGRDVPGMEP